MVAPQAANPSQQPCSVADVFVLDISIKPPSQQKESNNLRPPRVLEVVREGPMSTSGLELEWVGGEHPNRQTDRARKVVFVAGNFRNSLKYFRQSVDFSLAHDYLGGTPCDRSLGAHSSPFKSIEQDSKAQLRIDTLKLARSPAMYLSQTKRIAICCFLLALLLLPWCQASPQVQWSEILIPESRHVLSDDGGDSIDISLLSRFLDVEQSAVQRQIELYKRKAVILKALLSHTDDGDSEGGGDDRNANAKTTSSTQTEQTRRVTQLQQSRQRSYRQQQQHSSTQRFSDWFEFQSSYYPSELSMGTVVGAKKSPSEHIRIDLLSFRPNVNPNGKKNHAAQQQQQRGHKPGVTVVGDSALSPLFQFLAVFDMKRERIDLLHPVTKEIVWQHWFFDEELRSSSSLSTVSPITDYFFVSERMSYLATLRANGEVSLYKLRVLHNRRLLAGDHRVPSKLDPHMCMMSCDFSHKLRKSAMGIPLNLPWRMNTRSMATSTSPALNYSHIDFELIFRTSSSSGSIDISKSFHDVRAEKITVVTLYSHAYVITATSKGELSFFHGGNGTFIKSIATEFIKGEERALDNSVIQFEVLTTGIVAFAAGNRIQFINALDQSLIRGITCEVSVDEITSIDSDPWRYSTIYAGTSSGRGLVFRLLNFDRLKRKNGMAPVKVDENGNLVYDEESEPACVLVDQLLPKPKLSAIDQHQNPSRVQHQTSIRAIPGYLVMTTNTDIVLFQTNYDSLPKYITEYSTFSTRSAFQESSNSEQFVALSATRDPNTHPAALAVHVLEQHPNNSMARYRVDVYESLLPQPTSSLDLGWLRAPIMLLCAIAVMYWQQQNNNSNGVNQSDLGPLGLSHRGFGGKNADFDIAKFSKMVAARNHQR